MTLGLRIMGGSLGWRLKQTVLPFCGRLEVLTSNIILEIPD